MRAQVEASVELHEMGGDIVPQGVLDATRGPGDDQARREAGHAVEYGQHEDDGREPDEPRAGGSGGYLIDRLPQHDGRQHDEETAGDHRDEPGGIRPRVTQQPVSDPVL